MAPATHIRGQQRDSSRSGAGEAGQAGLAEVSHVTRSPTVADSALVAVIMQCAAWAVPEWSSDGGARVTALALWTVRLGHRTIAMPDPGRVSSLREDANIAHCTGAVPEWVRLVAMRDSVRAISSGGSHLAERESPSNAIIARCGRYLLASSSIPTASGFAVAGGAPIYDIVS
jgi:hypothetical protein